MGGGTKKNDLVYQFMWSNQYHKPTIWAVVYLYHLFVVILSYSQLFWGSFIYNHLSHCHFSVYHIYLLIVEQKLLGYPSDQPMGQASSSRIQPSFAVSSCGYSKAGESTWDDLGVPLL